MAAVCVILPAGCGSSKKTSGGKTAEGPSVKITIALTSSAFEQGKTIPEKYTGKGEDVSPPLAWSNLPEGTQELALICDDPDAPSPETPRAEPWVHWVIYNIPAGTTALAEGVPKTEKLDEPAGALQGTNDFGKIGYNGPMPPAGSGPHRYFFKLYALDTKLDVDPGLTKAELLQAMEGHELAMGELMGLYEVPQ